MGLGSCHAARAGCWSSLVLVVPAQRHVSLLYELPLQSARHGDQTKHSSLLASDGLGSARRSDTDALPPSPLARSLSLTRSLLPPLPMSATTLRGCC